MMMNKDQEGQRRASGISTMNQIAVAKENHDEIELLEQPPEEGLRKWAPPPRLLLGPGPANMHPAVGQALATPLIGHMDPAFIKIVEETKSLLRYAWQTQNPFTIPVSGTGSAAWEAVVANLTSPGDKHVVFVAGYFGERHMAMSKKYGAENVCIKKDYGEIFSLAEIRAAIEEHKPNMIWLCHGETSTGALQPLEGVGAVCREHNCLLLIDTVTTLGGVPLLLDDLQVDAAYTGAQKCLACPPGISALTLGPRALDKLDQRQKAGESVGSWYLDLSLIRQYINAEEPGAKRVYHHTAPVSMTFGLRESLALLAQEGLKASWKRHADAGNYLYQRLEALGLENMVAADHRLPQLTTVKIPDGIDGNAVIAHLREERCVEIGAALGQWAGKAWRIGLMGYNATRASVDIVTNGLSEALKLQGYETPCTTVGMALNLPGPWNKQTPTSQLQAVPASSKL